MKQAGTIAALLFLCLAGPAGAQQPIPQDMRSGQTGANLGAYGQTTLDVLTVPADAYFILTDFEIEVRTYLEGSCFVLVKESGASKWWSIVYGAANWIPATKQVNLKTGLVFQPGSVVQFYLASQTGNNQQNSINWSGYLVHNSQSAVPSEEGDGRGMGLLATPNPSADQASISFTVAERGNVTVAIFDVQGRRIRTLHQGALDAGKYSIQWDGKGDDGSEVANGTYFARVQTAEKAEVGKLIRVE